MIKVTAFYQSHVNTETLIMTITLLDTETVGNITLFPKTKEDMFELINALSKVVGKVRLSINHL